LKKCGYFRHDIINLKPLMRQFSLLLILCLSLVAWGKKPGKLKRSPTDQKERALMRNLKANESLIAYSEAIDQTTELGLYLKADSLINAALPLARRTQDSLAYYEFLRVQARLFTIMQRYPLALNYFKKALLYYQRENLWQQEGELTVNLIEFYRSSGQHPLALREVGFFVEDPRFEELSPLVKAKAYHRFAAIVAEYRQDPDSTILLSNRSLEYSTPDSLLGPMATSFNEIGYAYTKKKEARAIAYYEKSYEVFRRQHRVHYMCNALKNISLYYNRVQSYEQALVFIDSAISIAKPYTLPGFKGVAYAQKARVLFQLGRYREAYQYRDSASGLSLEFTRKRYDGELAIQSKRFETELNYNRMRAIDSERKQILEEAKSKDWRQGVYLFLLLILLGAVIGFLYFYRRLQRSKEHLEESQSALYGANQELINTLYEKEGLIEEVHHRVKNNLQLITSMIRVQQFQQQDKMSEESKAMVNEVLSRVSAMAVVHEKLYSQQQISQLRAKEYFSVLVEELRTLGGSFNKPLRVEVDAEDVVLGVSQGIALGMILSELVSNSLKHAFVMQDEPLIRLSIRKEKQGNRFRVVFSYEDNGKGYDSGVATGMGNRLINLFSRQMEAEQELDTLNRFYLKLAYWEE